jgi:serine/threonine protein kinase
MKEKPTKTEPFRYKNIDEHRREFELAKAYFNLYPKQTKIRKKNWEHVIADLHNKKPDLVPDLNAAKQALPKHSYLNEPDAANPQKNKVWALGNKIAEGGFGRVKHKIDEYGQHYAVKIETKNSKSQQQEETILKDLGLLVSNKFKRTSNQEDKYYTGLSYLGKDLTTRKDLKNKDKNFKELVTITRKTAWALHRLHSGEASQTKTKYAHCDIKPENIMLADNGKITLTDFGLSNKLDDPVTTLKGTWEYLPIQSTQGSTYHNQIQAYSNMMHLGWEKIDIIALKRTCLALFGKNFVQLNPSLHDSITNYLTTKQESALEMTLSFIEQEMGMASGALKYLSTDQKELTGAIFAELDKWEELHFQEPSQTDINRKVSQLRTQMAQEIANNQWYAPKLDRFFTHMRNRCSIYEKLSRLEEMSTTNNPTVQGFITEKKDALNQMTFSDEEQLKISEIQETINGLLSAHAKLADLSRLFINKNDSMALAFITDKQQQLNSPQTLTKSSITIIQKELDAALKGVQSEQMTELNQTIETFHQKGKKRYVFISADEFEIKAQKLEEAVAKIPLHERATVFSDHAEVQKALAYNRITNKKFNDHEELDESKAAKSFHTFKQKFNQMKPSTSDNVSMNEIQPIISDDAQNIPPQGHKMV